MHNEGTRCLAMRHITCDFPPAAPPSLRLTQRERLHSLHGVPDCSVPWAGSKRGLGRECLSPRADPVPAICHGRNDTRAADAATSVGTTVDTYVSADAIVDVGAGDGLTLLALPFAAVALLFAAVAFRDELCEATSGDALKRHMMVRPPEGGVCASRLTFLASGSISRSRSAQQEGHKI